MCVFFNCLESCWLLVIMTWSLGYWSSRLFILSRHHSEVPFSSRSPLGDVTCELWVFTWCTWNKPSTTHEAVEPQSTSMFGRGHQVMRLNKFNLGHAGGFPFKRSRNGQQIRPNPFKMFLLFHAQKYKMGHISEGHTKKVPFNQPEKSQQMSSPIILSPLRSPRSSFAWHPPCPAASVAGSPATPPSPWRWAGAGWCAEGPPWSRPAAASSPEKTTRFWRRTHEKNG